ncbi:MAG TPA: argininosuccinate synthase [Bdellovibrionales bacterium]|nr:argininosuccinate synthase [Bdellovibrionales bacterium]
MAKENSGKKVLLVYSGGLDTSICIPMMREEYGYKDVVTVTIDVGQDPADIKQAEEKAKILKTEHYTVDARETFVEQFCWPAVKANGDYQGYPMSTSIARPLITQIAAEKAKELGVKDFAHGCTGKGNDQYRIEFGIRSLIPQAVIHAPIRERNLTRSWELDYAAKKNIPVTQSANKIWSIDENLWGRSIEGGRLEEPDYAPPEDIFQWTKSVDNAEAKPQQVTLRFKNGVPVAIDGQTATPAQLVIKMNEISGRHGVGRVDIMEDRMMGLKVRENYECPGSTVFLKAHKALENLVLTRDEIRFKAIVDQEWSKLAYEGLWWDPYKEDLEAFIGSTQKRVTGEVKLNLYKGACTVIGRSSPWALYSEDLASFDTTTFDQRESTGAVKNFGLQARMYQQLLAKNQKEL